MNKNNENIDKLESNEDFDDLISINSDNTKHEGEKFLKMTDEEKKKRVEYLWGQCISKARGGVYVLKMFNDI